MQTSVFTILKEKNILLDINWFLIYCSTNYLSFGKMRGTKKSIEWKTISTKDTREKPMQSPKRPPALPIN